MQEQQIELQLELTDDLLPTCGDSQQIKQVLINLLLNAAEALPAQGGQICLRTRCVAQEVVIEVWDNGRGIPSEHLPRLFEPLFTTKAHGLGLGLAISWETIQQHQGTIRVQSQPGEKTCFAIHLPQHERCSDVARPPLDRG